MSMCGAGPLAFLERPGTIAAGASGVKTAASATSTVVEKSGQIVR